MNNHYDIAVNLLLKQAGLDADGLTPVLNRSMACDIDYADLFLQMAVSESWHLEDGEVKDATSHAVRGFGLRVISGEKTGLAYADDIAMPALNQAASMVRSLSYAGGLATVKLAKATDYSHYYPTINPLPTLAEVDKVALLQRIDTMARQMDTRVQQVMARLSGHYEVILLLNHQGQCMADIRPMVNLTVRVIVSDNGRQEQGYAGGGVRGDYHTYLADDPAQSHVEKAVAQALGNLDAQAAPAGVMPVVLGPGWPAVLLHEAVGHGLEGDFNRKGSSAFSNCLNERVASPLCTIVDDGTLPNHCGSLSIDDEGTPTQYTVLIENGILKNYMQDRLNARLMGMQPTGNGRRESYSHLPIPRMTNTYMLAGDSDAKEIIASVKKGLYAVDFSGGQVDITSGKFVFNASEAYLIENGKVTNRVKGAALVGHGPDVLTKVSMVGNDLAMDKGLGTCGKAGQAVPVGVGQPTLKVDELLVGGSG